MSNDNTSEKRDYVREAYECFIKNREQQEATDPVGAIQAHFDRTATPELKERVKAEGKTARGAYNFVFEVARIVNGGKSCHIDPATVYAIVMHYFEDVPAMGRFEPAIRKREEAKAAEERKAKAATEAAKPKKTPEEKKADAKAKRKARALKKKAEEEAKARAEEERKRKEAERRERAREEAAVAKIKAEKDHGQMFLFELI